MDGNFGALPSVGRMINSSQNFVAEHKGGTVVFNSGNTEPADERPDYGFGRLSFEEVEFNVTRYVKEFYRTLHCYDIRGKLSSYYHEDSVLTMEGEKIQGSQNIVAKLTSIPFLQFYRSITSIDCQPCGVNGSILVFVRGELQLVGRQEEAHKFSEIFHLMPTPQGSYYVLNDIFRVNSR